MQGASSTRRLNLGCGYDRREGYLNVDLQDFHSPDLIADIRDLPMLSSGHFEEILAFDCLEHLPRTDSARALEEWNRLLTPGGTLRLTVPDAAAILQRLAASDDLEEHERWLANLFGTQAYTGDFHQAGFTDILMIGLLARTGYCGIRIERRDDWLLSVFARKSYSPRPLEDDVALCWGEGVYPAEPAGEATMRWSRQQANVLLENLTGRDVDCRLRTIFFTGTAEPSTLEVRSDFFADVLTLDDRCPWERVVTMGPQRLRVFFSTDARALEAADDPRALHFGMYDFQISVELPRAANRSIELGRGEIGEVSSTHGA